MEHTELASLGGKARAKKLSKAARKMIAKKGGDANRRAWAAKKRKSIKRAAVTLSKQRTVKISAKRRREIAVGAARARWKREAKRG